MWHWLRKLFVGEDEILEKLTSLDFKITNLGKLNGSVAGVIALLQKMDTENDMAVQAILDKINSADTKLDAQAVVINDTKAEVDALKALIAAGADLSAVTTAVDDLAARVDAHGTALDDLKTDAAG